MAIGTKDIKAYQAWQALCKRISAASTVIVNETVEAQRKRVDWLLSDYERFCMYYFAHYCDAKMGWFHKEAANTVISDKDCFLVMEFPREHAKTVHACILMPMYLKALAIWKGTADFSGMILSSCNSDKADGLLGDVQAEMVSNNRYIQDFGEQKGMGSWEDGYFVDAFGNGFWAFGLGQSPRGAREAEKRPNYIVVDDADTDEMCRNEKRCDDAVDWILGALMGCLSLLGGRMIVSGNRIHKTSILAKIVGDIEPDDPKREDIKHIKVYATEGKKHEYVGFLKGEPAWKERYTIPILSKRMNRMGRLARREFYHQIVKKEYIFKESDFQYEDSEVINRIVFDALVAYCDPSKKNNQKSDTKAIIAVGKKGGKYYLVDCYCANSTPSMMAAGHYDIEDRLRVRFYRNTAYHYIEGNFDQDDALKYYKVEGEKRGYVLRIRVDDSKKADKFGRIESLEPLFVQGHMVFDKALKGNKHFRLFLNQLQDFPFGEHDDGPDALEGAISKADKKGKSSSFNPILGSGKKRKERRFKDNYRTI
jgi:predicted phage terminase large subunit-like protein